MKSVSVVVLVVTLVVALLLVAMGSEARGVDRCMKRCNKSTFNQQAKCIRNCYRQGKKKKKIPIRKVADEDDEILFDLMEALFLNDFDYEGEEQLSMSDSSAMSSPVNSEDMWDRYRGELIRFLKRSSPVQSGFDGLQIATTPIPAEWDTNPEQFQRLCDGGSKWSRSYEPNFSKSFINSYYEFLMAIPTDPTTDAQNANLIRTLEMIEQQMFDKEEEILTERGRCEDRYQKQSMGMTFDTFSRRYCTTYQTLEEEYLTLKGQVELTMRKAYGGLKNFKARRAVAKYVQTRDKRWNEVGTLKQFVSRNRSGQFNSFSLRVSKSSSHETSSFKTSSWGFNIIVISVNSAKKNVKLTTSLEQFDMQFSAKSWAAITVEPDSKWFHGGVVQDWAHGPLKNNMSPSTFFGAQGKISMYPRVLYVVYKPKIVLRLNKADAEKLEKEKSFGISVMSVFGVGFNFGKGSRFSKFQEKDNLFKVEIESNDDTPQIIAAQMAVLP